MPNQPKICRYFRSECIARVSLFILFLDSTVDNGLQGIASGVTWPKSDRRVEQTKKIPVEGQKVCSDGDIEILGGFRVNRRTSFQIAGYTKY